MAAHSTLSPSNAHRWLECTPSAVLEASLPRSESSYAAEGTLAHELGAALIDFTLGNITQEQYDVIFTECLANELWDDNILTYATMYKDVATQDFMSKDTIFTAVETKVSLQNYIKGAWGTADFVSYDGETLNVVDLKYGKGVAVSPEENPQLKLYALGVIDHFDLRQHKGLYVTLTIVQPRIDGVKSWTICCGELLDWAEDYVVPRARMAAKGEGDYRPSREVCRFCRAKPICKGLAEDIFASIQDMPTINTLTLDEVAANLSKSTLIKAWLVSMEEYVKDALLKNKPVPGWKLVEGRSNRKICDSMQAAALLRKAGYPDELTHKMTLFGITDLERLVGKKQLPEILGSTLAKPQGSPTIVESTDPRPAMNIDSITLEAFDNV